MSEEEKKRMMQTKLRSLRSAKKQIFTRKYLVVQTGCDNFCTFCLTVQARGRHKWRPLDEILDEIHTFVRNNGKEIVLTGINLGAWWAESSNDFRASKFVELVETILKKTDIERIRLSSIGVEFFSDELIRLFENPRINAYAHLSIQSGSTKILKKMNRHYDGEKVRDTLSKLRKIERSDGVNLNIGADIIAGFPGEDDVDFGESLAIIDDFQITQLHAFPFSGHIDHYNVPAGKFPNQVPNHISQNRTKTLLAHGNEQKKQFANGEIGKILRVLVEKIGENGKFSGWSENYLACNEENFIPDANQNIARGNVISGKFLGLSTQNEENDE